ncbi:possible exodeoxyribonuclease V 67 kD polypeptide [Prochlorococcus marinus str. MIT 9515]|uniref:Possible exodeoxyribonuclease V 67 kD polypeptide n=1 Tax=Prochlorococcus marinus (strain MIT 9515) TaxID=167542 RepID=A2BX89_PROM5|nr:AAA family ATPase [Prochlorococcus marinus]ABM72400.1 possible exodeoxyribonuclease V 67 kD polypeptide [Prochlorococcus marinus str. MIT 9515]
MNYKKQDIEEFEYIHIFNLLKDILKFNEKKYGDYVKDTLKILLELEKNGETIIDVDKTVVGFELLKDGWPNIHLKVLKDIGLLNSVNSPFVFNNRKLTLVKWSRKIKRVLNAFLKKIDKIAINSNNDNKLDQIKNIFKSSNLVFLQGGPGTGKTTMIINFILYCLKSDTYLNIGLAAPTGKATSRLKESLNQQKDILLSNSLDQIECQTLHKWIFNSNNKAIEFKFKLKELDIFIIDEMSMVNIDIIETILDLIAKDCKIILVGDRNQLSPVKNCSIWNYLFEYSDNKLINSCIVNLKKTYRNSGDISLLSNLVFNNNNSLFNKKINELEKEKKIKEINILKSNNTNIPIELLNIIKNNLSKLRKSTSNLSNKKYIFDNNIDNLISHEKDLVNKILFDLQSHLILCEKNTGNWSVEDINDTVIGKTKPYDFKNLEEGLPIMCTKNNYELGISNGDIGVLIGNNDNRKYLFRKFNDNNELVVQLIDPSNLENIVPAIAITIHKSQGSESEKVSILWLKKTKLDESINSDKKESENIFFRDNYEKRLLYTAITRAKKLLDIYYLN